MADCRYGDVEQALMALVETGCFAASHYRMTQCLPVGEESCSIFGLVVSLFIFPSFSYLNLVSSR